MNSGPPLANTFATTVMTTDSATTGTTMAAAQDSRTGTSSISAASKPTVDAFSQMAMALMSWSVIESKLNQT